MNESTAAPTRSPGALSAEDERSQAGTLLSYERIPYRSKAWPASATAHLHTLALLHGLEAAPPRACRVLELGCADGGNLIPLAAHHRGSSCVGIDLAKGHIDRARAHCERLALDNARFEACSFVELANVLGDAEPFDYVVAHGLMSWVTPTLQDALFGVVRRWLAPRGVALVSYNTYPGWSGPRAIRELLKLHNRGVDDVAQRVARSRALLELLAATVPARDRAYLEQIQAVLEIANDPSKLDYFAHEYLEDENHPFFVRDFVERAERSGLRYVADADLPDMQPERMPEGVEASQLDRIERLQLQDMMTNRRFRQSVLCRGDAHPNEHPDLGLLDAMYVTTELAPRGEVASLSTSDDLELRDRKGRAVVVDEPIVKAALLRFSEVGRHPVAFDELLEWAHQRLGAARTGDAAEARAQRAAVAETLGQLHLAGMASLRATAPDWAAEPGERPVASPLARALDDPDRPITSLRHKSVALESPLVRELLPLLDGSRDRAALLEHFAGRLGADELEQILAIAAEKALLLAEPA